MSLSPVFTETGSYIYIYSFFFGGWVKGTWGEGDGQMFETLGTAYFALHNPQDQIQCKQSKKLSESQLFNHHKSRSGF